MKSKLLSVLMLMLAIFPAMQAQTPMPLNPKVKSGVLPNGLSYYVLHNEEPKGRANFYIAQKVGSTLETPDQLGLAHFLEHMAFNGTATYPGKNMLNYLQSKGVRFGADINAYTSFDETVYNLNNIPTNDQNLMDSVLLVLRDWSGSILLEESEIDAERGVIQEEWRSRNDARTRMFTKILPDLYEEYQYEQMPIGKMEVVMNFKPEVLRAYYKKWYRPDQQGIVIVGDFDADAMEKKVVELFSSIPMPENAAERVYPTVSDNKDPLYVTYMDPELQADQVFVCFKYDKTPFEYRNTLEAYMQDSVLEGVIANLIQNRLSEYTSDPNCKYAYAGLRFGDYFVSKTKGAITITIIPKDDVDAAIADAMGIIARACKTGFTQSELERVDSEIISQYERSYNERDKTDSDALGTEIIRHFVDNEPAPGIETEYQLVSMALPTIPVEAVNEVAGAILTAENQVIVVAMVERDGRQLPSKEEAVGTVENALNAQYEAYVDEVITEPLIAKLPKPGKITATTENPELATTTYTLSNGAKVVVKPTDFSSDEVIFTAFREGGRQQYADSQAANVLMIEDAFEQSKIGPFDVKTLRKYLAGKQVSLAISQNYTVDQVNGTSTVKDLPTLFELVYAAFTDLNADSEQYYNTIARYLPMMENQDKDPMKVFQRQLLSTMWNGNPMMLQVNADDLRNANYDEMLAMVKTMLANAADYTFVITGNVDLDTLKPLLEQYIATLPSSGKKSEVVALNKAAIATGIVDNTYNQPMQTPAVVVADAIDNDNLDYNLENETRLGLLADVLEIIYTNTLREEEGGTYGASVAAQMVPFSHQWMLLYNFQTSPDKRNALIERAKVELKKLLAEGADAETFNKVKGAALSQLEIKERNNHYWDAQLVRYERGYDFLTGRKAALENLTLEEFNNYISKIYNGQNNISVIMDGVAAE